jgi:hypothetical protein
VRFWFSPVDPVGLHWLRFAAGVFFIASLLPFAGHIDDMIGLGGWFDQQAYRDMRTLPEGSPFLVSWSIYYLCGTNSLIVAITYWASIGVLVLFTLGVYTRLTSILSWVALASFASNPALAYEGDLFLTMPAFYLMIAYVLLGQRQPNQSWVSRILGPAFPPLLRRRNAEEIDRGGSVGANLGLRLLQVHFAIVMVTSGLHKLQSGDWWSGVAFWYALYPPLETTAEMVRRHAADATSLLTVLSIGAYATLAWQLGFPFFAWRRRWGPVLLGGAALAWLGNAFLFRLPIFGPGIFICCLSYLSVDEWRRLNSWLARLPGLAWLEGNATLRSHERVVDAREEAVVS